MAYGFNDDKSKADVYTKTELNAILNNKLLVVKKDVDNISVNLPPNSTALVSESVSKSGYTAIGIIGIDLAGTNVYALMRDYYIDGTVLNFRLKNISSEREISFIPRISFYILYIKN